MSYSADIQRLHREAPQGTGKIQAVQFIFQGDSRLYVRNDKDLMLSPTVGAPLQNFERAPFEVDQPQVAADQKQSLNISFPYAATDLYEILQAVSENMFFTIQVNYMEYYLDGNTVTTDPGYILSDLWAFAIPVDEEGTVTIQASTDNLRTLNVGELYTYDEFYTLRNM